MSTTFTQRPGRRLGVDTVCLSAAPNFDCGAFPCSPGYGCTYENFSLVPCQRCPRHLISPQGRACTACLAGQSSDASQSACVACVPGRAGSGLCEACAPGRYPNLNATGCQECDVGTYSSEGSVACTQCPSGSYSPRAAQSCRKCRTGQQPSSTGDRCGPCPALTVSPEGKQCLTCPDPRQPDKQQHSCALCSKELFFNRQTRGCEECRMYQTPDANGTGCRCEPTRYNASVRVYACMAVYSESAFDFSFPVNTKQPCARMLNTGGP